MHILIVLHDFDPGGAERIAIRLASRWALSGAVVTLVCGRPSGPLRSLLSDQVQLLMPANPISRSRFSRVAVAVFAARMASAVVPDLIFLPGNFYAGMAPILKLKLGQRCPVIVTKLSNVLRRPERGRATRIAFEVGLIAKTAFADHVVAMSPELLEEARRVLPWRDSRFSVLSQPVLDDELADGSVSAPAGVDSRPLLVAAGRLIAQKNFAGLIEAVARIDRPYQLVILGEGPERGRLLAKVDDLQLSAKVTLPGYAPDLGIALADARLFILSSDYEGFPSVVVEALGAGVPVVATDCSPGMATLFNDSKVGQLVPVSDPISLANAIMAALDGHPPDPDRLRQSVEPFRISPAARAYLNLFGRLAAGRRARVK